MFLLIEPLLSSHKKAQVNWVHILTYDSNLSYRLNWIT